MRRTFKIGDPVIYSKRKESVRPGPRARDIQPSLYGETYTYQIEKFWVVVNVSSDLTLVVQTRRGKQHRLASNDPCLRRASWFERLWYRDRFPQLKEQAPPQ
jgi:hypothetical protein